MYTHTRKLWIIYLYFFISTISLSWYKTYFYACFKKTPQTYHVWFFNSLHRGDFLMYAGIRLDVGAPDVKTQPTGAKNKESFRLVDRGLHETASTISTVIEAFTKKQWSSLFPGPCMPFVENIDFQSVSLGPGLKKNVSSMRFGDASEIEQLWSTNWYQLRVLMMHHSHVTSTSTRLGFSRFEKEGPIHEKNHEIFFVCWMLI